MRRVKAQEWKAFYDQCPQAHILQSAAWGELKSQFGWRVRRIKQQDLGAQILFQDLPLGGSLGYLPRGPICSTQKPLNQEIWQHFLTEIDSLCKAEQAAFLKWEPDAWEGEPQQLPVDGFQEAAFSVQPPRTILINLEDNEDEILSRMKSKTRYNIRLAGRKEVTVRKIDDVDTFYNMLENTADRADFGIHTRNYYQKVYQLFQNEDACTIFLAEYQGIPLASIMVFHHGNRAWYFYGASSAKHRDRMPTYLVQWEAMRWVKQQGCLSYDLWGVPDADFEQLEDQFLERSDGLWGVYRFKRGFGGELKRASGPWDRVYKPLIYELVKIWQHLRNQGS